MREPVISDAMRDEIAQIRQRAVEWKSKGRAEINVWFAKRGLWTYGPPGSMVEEYDTHNWIVAKCDDMIEWADKLLSRSR